MVIICYIRKLKKVFNGLKNTLKSRFRGGESVFSAGDPV